MLESSTKAELSQMSTQALKAELLSLTEGRDIDPLGQKVQFYRRTLEPLFNELARRNPFPNPEAQGPLVVGGWLPVWSTIPFQDTLPGRMRDQSYQIFHDNGYYANIARYAPGSRFPLVKKFSAILFAYDLMIVQKFAVKNGQWLIQNVGIEQALRLRGLPLGIDKAQSWFAKVLQSKRLASPEMQSPELDNLDQRTGKKFKQIFLATPQLEHLYIDHDFRLVKTQREAKQRPSYTIAVRKLYTS